MANTLENQELLNKLFYDTPSVVKKAIERFLSVSNLTITYNEGFWSIDGKAVDRPNLIRDVVLAMMPGNTKSRSYKGISFSMSYPKTLEELYLLVWALECIHEGCNFGIVADQNGQPKITKVSTAGGSKITELAEYFGTLIGHELVAEEFRFQSQYKSMTVEHRLYVMMLGIQKTIPEEWGTRYMSTLSFVGGTVVRPALSSVGTSRVTSQIALGYSLPKVFDQNFLLIVGNLAYEQQNGGWLQIETQEGVAYKEATNHMVIASTLQAAIRSHSITGLLLTQRSNMEHPCFKLANLNSTILTDSSVWIESADQIIEHIAQKQYETVAIHLSVQGYDAKEQLDAALKILNTNETAIQDWLDGFAVYAYGGNVEADTARDLLATNPVFQRVYNSVQAFMRRSHRTADGRDFLATSTLMNYLRIARECSQDSAFNAEFDSLEKLGTFSSEEFFRIRSLIATLQAEGCNVETALFEQQLLSDIVGTSYEKYITDSFSDGFMPINPFFVAFVSNINDSKLNSSTVMASLLRHGFYHVEQVRLEGGGALNGLMKHVMKRDADLR